VFEKLVTDEAFLAGVESFNRGDYFLAHEIWEDIWFSAGGEARSFLQGLIQWSLALHHFQRGNLKGARKLFESGDQLLEPLLPVWQGVSLADLRQAMISGLESVLSRPLDFLSGRDESETAPVLATKPSIYFTP